MTAYAPIALFVYARPDHTRRTVEALQHNELASESDLIVFSDAPRSDAVKDAVSSVRTFVRTIGGFRSVTVIERPQNLGLAPSIIDGVTEVIRRYGKVIVVEDDLITSRFFLRYMNDALAMYEHDDTVISIHGYTYPLPGAMPETFFIRGADCWGWATWKRGWELFRPDGAQLLRELRDRDLVHAFDWDGHYRNITMLERQITGKVDSWAIRWHASAFLAGKLTLYPGRSLVTNIGGDAFGTHTKSLEEFRTELADRPVSVERLPLTEDPEMRKRFVDFFGSIKRSLLHRIMRKIASYFS